MVTDRHASKEISIFSRFAAVSGLSIGEASIEKRPPPEPDILCNIEGVGDVAFELVELIDRDLAKREYGQLHLKSIFEQSFEACGPDTKSVLAATIGNALVHVTFADVGFRQKKLAVADVLNLLATVNADFAGEIRPDSLPAVESIRVARVRSIGPFFDVDAVGFFAEPTVERFRAKWFKHYETPHRRELLAYFELQPELPKQLWHPKLELFVQQNWPSSPFERVWVYDCATRRIAFCAHGHSSFGA
jgi:hypothetical protein